jgi:nucleoside recognition membrane protein YjiH
MEKEAKLVSYPTKSMFKFFVYSIIGIFMFFIPIDIGGKSTIPIDHLVNAIKALVPNAMPIYALLVIILGGLYPFYKKTWKKDAVTLVFSILKLLGIGVAVMAFLQVGPAWLFEADMVPFLFNKLVIPVGLIVPIGSAFLSFLVGYGLLEFFGIIMMPIMRPVFKTPGRSAIDAVASFVGSYSIGLLITNRVFKEGKYSVKEAAIIATGFSTVSATFMIIVAKTLGLMDFWNLFFWVTLVVTFSVTAITVRLKPLSAKEDRYFDGVGDPEIKLEGNIFKNAMQAGLEAADESLPLFENVMTNLKDGFIMVMGILPSILSVGLIGLTVAKYTPVFDWLAYGFYPFTWAMQIPEPMLTAKALAVGIAEMFLPALLMASAPLVSKFIVAVVSISSILFFSASIPCILSTEIPISLKDIVFIWFQRTLLTLILVTPIAFVLF